ncbi:MAG: hypothetical protein AAB933_02000 [Patescibacteria group bacterium]|mgnify:CR=1 FL=1
MSYNEDEEIEDGFRIGADEDEIGEPLDMPDISEEIPESDDPEDKYH